MRSKRGEDVLAARGDGEVCGVLDQKARRIEEDDCACKAGLRSEKLSLLARFPRSSAGGFFHQHITQVRAHLLSVALQLGNDLGILRGDVF